MSEPLSDRGQFVKHAPADHPAEAGHDQSVTPLFRHYVTTVDRLRSKQEYLGQPTVAVSDSLGVLAFAYEKVRNSVEYREDHVLLRNAIKRILKRRLNPMWQYESIASALLRELIWARYLKNDSVPQSKVVEIEELLRKYNVLRQEARQLHKPEEWQDWIIGIAACDIEQVLVPRQAGYALAEVMYQSMTSSTRIVGIDQADWPIQLYLAVHRTLLKSDRTLLTYHLFMINAVGWQDATVEQAAEYGGRLEALREAISAQMQHQYAQDLARQVKRHTPPFRILDDLVTAQPDLAMGTLSNPVQLRRKTEEFCKVRYADMHTRVRRAIVRSVIYIFITKMAMALVLEVPYDTYYYNHIQWPQLMVNVLFPPIFMIALGMSIRTPSAKNTEAIFKRLQDAVTGHSEVETMVVGKKRSTLAPMMSLFFLSTSILTFALLAWLLWWLHFTPLGLFLFIFFFCVVVFFAYRVRQIAQEMSVIREKENIFEGMVTLLTLPFLRIGFKLSAEFGKVNVFAFILDVLLEAPFKLILDLIEHWLAFLRQKREEVVDTHEY